MSKQKICFVGGTGAGPKAKGRLCGPRRLTVELAKRLEKKYTCSFIHLGQEKNTSLAQEIPLKNDLFKFFRILNALRKEKPQIIHGHGSLNMAFVLRWAKILLRKKTIITFTDFKENVTKNYNILNTLDHIIVQTDYARKRLIDAGVREEKITKITYGVEEKFYQAKICPEVRDLHKKIIFYYGDARKERGFQTILDALPLLKEDLLFIIGIRNFHEGFSPKIVEKKQKNVKFMTIAQYPCSIQDMIASVDVVVLPFTHNTLEPPLTLLEVSAVGTDLIATDIGGNKEVISQNSSILEKQTGEELAQLINSYTPKNEKQAQINYSWQKVIESVEELYQQ